MVLFYDTGCLGNSQWGLIPNPLHDFARPFCRAMVSAVGFQIINNSFLGIRIQFNGFSKMVIQACQKFRLGRFSQQGVPFVFFMVIIRIRQERRDQKKSAQNQTNH